jgi:hypothetical protein
VFRFCAQVLRCQTNHGAEQRCGAVGGNGCPNVRSGQKAERTRTTRMTRFCHRELLSNNSSRQARFSRKRHFRKSRQGCPLPRWTAGRHVNQTVVLWTVAHQAGSSSCKIFSLGKKRSPCRVDGGRLGTGCRAMDITALEGGAQLITLVVLIQP